MNGSLVGYFQSGRGMRRGDPISPYLFLLSMEAFTKLLERNTTEKGYDYHPKCEGLKLSHVSFADDLFIITAATAKSFQVINETLNEFAALSGLQPNLQKSQIFFAGIEEVMEQQLFSTIQMPKGEMKNQYCAEVKWKDICLPKKESGLGIFDLDLWNRCLILKQVWNISCRKKTLWIKWIHSLNLKQDSFWGMKVPLVCTWAWRKILKLRTVAKQLIRKVIGDGKSSNFWYDSWHLLAL
ncbi:hypothetical protein ACH5RR_003091 [Cinchona calisaya]|uniref:Reverse transcriptase domain-containing protein n=1 Tax=Cinchona calisaya TaxID=153742 RepID=A0ABD3ATV3_9GENT